MFVHTVIKYSKNSKVVPALSNWSVKYSDLISLVSSTEINTQDIGTYDDYVVLGRALHQHLHSPRFPIHLASSFVHSAPASFFRTPTKVGVGHPLDRCPCVGFHSTIFLAGSCWCRWQWPASLILLPAIFSDTPGNVPYRSLLVMYLSWLMFSTTHSILV